ncbi:hypothetical protein SAMN02745220_00729 [Desulfopila aestuarii DSM 18488]|uniref:Uncharacterized protein n=1 Tax=Desulfopila aestuarii DSM 18488 TaxID=1121416 RepID=A0A1M7XZ24_9BACT|nr:hypothetical protein SAMN02745220_00729 [Desulfopila aestuarii DSM 18488]
MEERRFWRLSYEDNKKGAVESIHRPFFVVNSLQITPGRLQPRVIDMVETELFLSLFRLKSGSATFQELP